MRRSTLVRRTIRRCATALDCRIEAYEVVVVGDTPRDVRAAHQGGAKCMAVATGKFTVDELRRERPMAVVPDLSDTDRVSELLVRA
jgi:phosphoglycolate phosphatase